METAVASKPSTKEGFSKYLRKNMYRWHRIVGIITLIPVIFWTLSGLMHPFMSHWFKPKLAKEFIPAKPLAMAQITLPLSTVLAQHQLTQIKNFRIVSFKGHTYYQVKRVSDNLVYFDASTGVELPKGDLIYAEWMARTLSQDSTSRIKSITVQTEFDNQYKFVNRLLPVYKVSFERPDGLDVYVETASTRMATFNTNSRKIFIWIFDVFHNWSFLDAISNTKIRIVVMLLCIGSIMASTLLGLLIYGFMWGKFKKPRADDSKGILKKYHRQIGLWVSFVTFTFAFSGGYHALKKWTPDNRLAFSYEPTFKVSDLQQTASALALPWEKVTNISLVQIKNQACYFVTFKKEEEQTPQPSLINAQTGKEIAQGNLLYAEYLTNKFANMATAQAADEANSMDCCEPTADTPNTSINHANLLETAWLTKFDKEYGFVNKRLPVVKLAYKTDAKTTYYIETSTGKLASKIENSDRREGWSFAILHKYLLMEWAGKDVRDIVTLLSALGVLVVSLFGLALFLKKK